VLPTSGSGRYGSVLEALVSATASAAASAPSSSLEVVVPTPIGKLKILFTRVLFNL